MPLSFDPTILWPVTVVVALTLVSATRLLALRIRAIRSKAISTAFYKTYRDGTEPEQVAAAARHYTNLFETPVLFYVGCLVASLLGPVSSLALLSAWAFTAFRVVQSTIHLTSNTVRWRAYAFFASFPFLLLLWASNIWALSAL